ncbi:MAG: hypothetical protein ORN28_02230, partial [Rhodoferax sp.]|nr:hypothetical protein [Rhodoferax sp.]
GSGGGNDVPVWLTGSGDPANALGNVGNYYQDTSQATPGNKIWLKTQNLVTPYWVRQPNLENAISSYVNARLTFGFAKAAAASNIALTGIQIIDGVSVIAGDVVLAANQTTKADSGIYVVSASTWSRVVSTPVIQGLVVVVSLGTTYEGDSFIQTAPITTVGTSPQTWSLFSVNGGSSLQATCAVGRTVNAANSNITLFNDIASPFTFTNNSGSIQIGNSTNRLQFGSTGTLTFGTGANAAFLDQSGNITASTLKVTGLSPTANVITLTGSGTGVATSITTTGSDSNVDLNISAKGLGSVVLGNQAKVRTYLSVGSDYANSITLSGGSLGNDPVITATGETAVNLNLGAGASGAVISLNRFITLGTATFNSNATNYVAIVGANTAVAPTIVTLGGDTNIDLSLAPKGTGKVSTTNSAVIGTGSANNITLTPSATTVAPAISATGSDTNIDLSLSGKGTGSVTTVAGFKSGGTAIIGNSSVNNVTIAGAATGIAPTISATGANTNIDLALSGKGTGNVTAATNFRVAGNTIIGTTSSNNITLTGAALSVSPVISATGNDTNIGLSFTTKGTGNVLLGNTTSYSGIQVTGGQSTYAELAVRSGATNTDLRLTPKGTGVISLYGSTNIGSNLANYINIIGAAAGASPIIQPAGTDSNIDLTLTAKGTSSVVAFGPFKVTGLSNLGTGTGSDNYIRIGGNSPGTAPYILAFGPVDTNVDLNLSAQGSGSVVATGTMKIQNQA